MSYDFCGWATKNDTPCTDGRTIRQGAFKDDNKKKVPLVWQHQHNFVDNVLGHAILENRPEGVYAYGYLNDAPSGQTAKAMLKNGDISYMSIYANQLKEIGGNVVHGVIREVSLVLAGANPGAKIETVLVHSDDDYQEAEITTGEAIELYHSEDVVDETNDTNSDESNDSEIEHADKEKTMPADTNSSTASKDSDKTNQEALDVPKIIAGMTEDEKDVMYYLIGKAIEKSKNDGADEEENDMKHNVFDNDNNDNTLIHAEDIAEAIKDGKRYGSLRESFEDHGIEITKTNSALAHGDYGINNIDMLFPDYRNLTNIPGFVSRDMGWVSKFMGAVSHTPFSRIKTVFADITEDEARAKGYTKGNLKLEEVFTLLKRTTDPQTVYKKQKFDKDDLDDITDLDTLSWVKTEMRMMFDEEIARAILVGDGRSTASNDKIKEDHIRPIWTDDSFYSVKASFQGNGTGTVTIDETAAKTFIRTAIKARKNYKGSGNPTLYTTEDMLTEMLLLTDEMGRDLYDSPEKLAQKLRVKEIVTVPVMENLVRTGGSSDGAASGKKLTPLGIIVNPVDYNVGTDKGGQINFFDDFDIDYNQQKFLIESRMSGALIKPYAAIVVEAYPKA